MPLAYSSPSSGQRRRVVAGETEQTATSAKMESKAASPLPKPSRKESELKAGPSVSVIARAGGETPERSRGEAGKEAAATAKAKRGDAETEAAAAATPSPSSSRSSFLRRGDGPAARALAAARGQTLRRTLRLIDSIGQEKCALKRAQNGDETYLNISPLMSKGLF